MAPTWWNFKNVFSIPLFTIIFRPKIVSLDTDSILRVKTMYESVKWDALKKAAHNGVKNISKDNLNFYLKTDPKWLLLLCDC